MLLADTARVLKCFVLVVLVCSKSLEVAKEAGPLIFRGRDEGSDVEFPH